MMFKWCDIMSNSNVDENCKKGIVFISFSKERSKLIAEEIKGFIWEVLEIEAFMSADIQSGADWPNVIEANLNQSSIIISCFTSENKDAPWIWYEAGALHNNEIVPLLIDLNFDDITKSHPLQNKEGVKLGDEKKFNNLIKKANELRDVPHTESMLSTLWKAKYPEFDLACKNIIKNTESNDRVEKRIDDKINDFLKSIDELKDDLNNAVNMYKNLQKMGFSNIVMFNSEEYKKQNKKFLEKINTANEVKFMAYMGKTDLEDLKDNLKKGSKCSFKVLLPSDKVMKKNRETPIFCMDSNKNQKDLHKRAINIIKEIGENGNKIENRTYDVFPFGNVLIIDSKVEEIKEVRFIPYLSQINKTDSIVLFGKIGNSVDDNVAVFKQIEEMFNKTWDGKYEGKREY